MAKTDIGPKISVEGEKEYRQQMQNIIARQKEYAAELKSTTASMDENTSAEQRASSVAAVLRKQIAAQTDAMNAQKSMLLQATEKYGSASTQASAYRTAVYKTNAELETLKSRLRDAENGLGEFASKADDAKGSLDGLTNTDAGSGMFDGLQSAVTKGSIAANLFSKVSSTIIAAGKQVVSTGVQYNAQLEQYQTALTNMLGSEAEAVALLDEVKQDAAKTPFDTAGLVKANELLISTGIDAESSRRTILALGDAVSATGGGNEELSRMAQNLQQIQNAGKATSADIKQFAYAGIDVYGILADYTGKSAEEVQKMTVTYDLLSNALISAADEGGRYFNSMSTQSETLNGQWSTLKDNATQLAGLMTGDLTDGVKTVIGHMNDLTVAASEAYDTGGWFGLADAIASNIPIVSELKTGFENATTAAINFLDRASYALNKGLGKNAYAGYNSYEDYQKDQKKKSSQTEEARRKAREERGRKHAERVRQAQAQAASNYIVPTYNGSGGSGRNGGSGGSGGRRTTAKTAQDTKKLAKTVTNTSKQLLQGTENIVGAISRTVETADNTYNVYDGTTKKLKDTTTETVQTITDSWTEMVDGVETQFKRVQTLTDGVVTSEKVTSSLADEVAKKSVHTRAETLTAAQAEIDEAIGYVSRTAQTSTETKKVLNAETGALEDTVVSATKVVTDCYKRIVEGQEQTVERTTTYTNGIVTDVNEKVTDLNTSIKYTEGALGGFSKFVLDLDTKLGGLEKVASNLTKSPLGQWLSDLAQGYRASDSFWDNIDVVGLLVGGVKGFATGTQITQSVAGGIAGAIIGVAGNLLGTSISTEAGSWGADLVTGLAKGISGGGGIIAKAVSWIGGIIKGFLHFSRPDEGPLREYEKWMPDMIQGMADGIRDNAYLLQEAAADLGGKLKMQLQYDVGSANGFAQVATNSRTVRMGGITFNVYPSADMDEERFAQYTITRLTQMINEEAAASGEVPVF
jgi:tape measure domain-containing protein|nr:MAG TPA: tail tape measure protein [Caudoviricetes sp.]